MSKENYKHSDEYGDAMREEQRDRNIDASYDNIKEHFGEWRCTDAKCFAVKGDAVDHQYNIERGHA
jgi:hypothetical protein